MPDREVVAHELLDPNPWSLPVGLALLAHLLGDRGGDEVVLGVEVGVEGAVGQPRVGHERGNARSVDPVTLEPPTGRLDDPPPGRFLVLLAVPGHTPSLCRTARCALSSGHYSTT